MRKKLRMILKRLYYGYKELKGYFLNLFSVLNGRLSLRSRAFLYGHIQIPGKGKILLGKGVIIRSGKRENPIGGDTRSTLYAREGATIVLDDNAGVSNVTIVAYEGVTIGRDVKIGNSVKIYDCDFHALDPALRKNATTDRGVKLPIVIKDNAFIGAHSIILKGVTIGENAIVGAGSVVTKSIPDNEVWGGSPAKFLKRLECQNSDL